MKRCLTTILLSLAATTGMAADERPSASSPTAVPVAPSTSATTDAWTATQTTSGSSQPVQAAKPNAMVEAEVVSKDMATKTLTFKKDDKEQTARVDDQAATALKVVWPGDKVRVLYKDDDNNGTADVVTSVLITEPAKASKSTK